jgi:multisubunit Na+/H+ antiporter MnhC subunit
MTLILAAHSDAPVTRRFCPLAAPSPWVARARRACQNQEVTGTRPTQAADWIEPTSRLPLRWGRYRARWVLGLALIVMGIGLIQLTSAYSLEFAVIGVPVEAAGWIIQPTTVARRAAVILPALAVSMALLAGPGFSILFAILLGCWLIVRLRPGISWSVLVLPVASSLMLSGMLVYYPQDWLSLLIGAAVCIAAAWIALALAKYAEARHSVSRDPDPLG